MQKLSVPAQNNLMPYMNGHNTNPIGFGLEQQSNNNIEDKNTDSSQIGYALVINGDSLVHALKKKYEKLFLEIGCLCIVCKKYFK